MNVKKFLMQINKILVLNCFVIVEYSTSHPDSLSDLDQSNFV